MSGLGVDDGDLDPDPSQITRLRELVEVQRDTVMAIATGSPIDSQRAGYRSRLTRLQAALHSSGLPIPFRWPDADHVWAWAKRWATYDERRSEVDKLITPLLDQLDTLERSGRVDDWGGSHDGWAELEQRVLGLRNEM